MKRTADITKGLILQLRRTGNRKINKNIRTNFNSLKTMPDDKEFRDNFEALFNSKIANTYITSNFFPKRIEEIGEFWNVEYCGNFEYEIRWLIYCIRNCKDTINEFVQARQLFDRYILFDDFDRGMEIINKIEKNWGFTYWGSECKLYLQSKLHSEIVDRNQGMGTAEAIIRFYELKNSINMTYDKYSYLVSKEINGLRNEFPNTKDLLEYYNYMILPREFQMSDENILSLLKYAIYDSIIDQYILFIDICCYFLGEGKNGNYYSLIQRYVNELSDINDEQLVALRFSYDSKENRRQNYVLKSRLISAKENYINGELEMCYYTTLSFLEKFPNNIEAINLLIDAKVLLENEAVEFPGTNLGKLIESLTVVYAMRENRNENMNNILTLVNILAKSTWAGALMNSIKGRCHQIGSDIEKHEKKIAFAQYLDIETICNNLKTEDAIDYFNSNLNFENRYVNFRKLIIQKKYIEADSLCDLNGLHRLLYVCRVEKDIYSKKDKLCKIEGNEAILEILICRIFFKQIDLKENFELGLEEMIKLAINNKYAVWFVPIREYIDYIEDNNIVSNNICIPILYYLYYFYFQRDRKDDLAIRCDDFFFEEGIDFPSKMKNYKKCNKEKLIFFLRYVCTTDILSSAICDIENSLQLQRERLDICQILCQLDADNENYYENEIREITQRLMIEQELTIIEENRIHVNVAGMRPRLTQELKNDFLTYQICKDTRFELLQKILEDIKKQQDDTFQSKEKQTNDTYNLIDGLKPENIFKALIVKIRDAFVSSDEYGLDGYLSLNIRHGTLGDELKSPLVSAELSAVYETQKKDYTIGEIWEQEAHDGLNFEIIKKAIVKFNLSTNQIIQDLKGKYIQIKTEKNQSEGWFDYSITKANLLDLPFKIKEESTFDEFLDIVFEFLWELTEDNLHIIKSKIKQQISDRYEQAFKTLKKDVEGVNNKAISRELNRKINEAYNDMQNILDKIGFWFQRSEENKNADFDLDFVFLMGLTTIHNMHPECKFKPTNLNKEVTDKKHKIRGKYLKNFADIFYNIFDNIYKNAMRSKGVINIEYLLEYKEDIIHIYVRNKFNCSKDLTDEKRKIKEAKELIANGSYLNKIRNEGGTGIPKICKIISVDLNSKPDINFDFIEKKNKFFIELKFRKEYYEGIDS